MRYDPDRTYHYAVAAVASGFGWIYAYAIYAAIPYLRRTGNPRRMIRAETQYGSYLAYAYGEYGLLLWALTLATLGFGAAWAYRAWADDWHCLYAHA